MLPDLLALQLIDPELNGLKQVIFDVRVAVGLEQKPKDPADVRRSDELTAEARSIWDELGRLGADRALALVNQALELNLDNENASRLKDEIARGTGAQVSVTLSPADQALFRKAQELYAAGSYLQAWVLVRKLLDDTPDNARYGPLKDLEARLEPRVR